MWILTRAMSKGKLLLSPAVSCGALIEGHLLMCSCRSQWHWRGLRSSIGQGRVRTGDNVSATVSGALLLSRAFAVIADLNQTEGDRLTKELGR